MHLSAGSRIPPGRVFVWRTRPGPAASSGSSGHQPCQLCPLPGTLLPWVLTRPPQDNHHPEGPKAGLGGGTSFSTSPNTPQPRGGYTAPLCRKGSWGDQDRAPEKASQVENTGLPQPCQSSRDQPGHCLFQTGKISRLGTPGSVPAAQSHVCLWPTGLGPTLRDSAHCWARAAFGAGRERPVVPATAG